MTIFAPGYRPRKLFILLLCVAVEVCGRFLFPNYDINYLVYGAQFYTHNKLPWMDVWTGLDFIHGRLALLLGSPEAAIFATAIAINVVVAFIIDDTFGKYCTKPSTRAPAVIATVLFFQPLLGGWTADHMSYLCGIIPAFVFILNRFTCNKLVASALGFSLATGLTLKLNSFVPTYCFTFAWLILAIFFLPAQKTNSLTIGRSNDFKHLFPVFAFSLLFTAIFITAMVPLDGGVYPSIIQTYRFVSESTARGQFTVERALRIPLQADLVQAFLSNQRGVIIFAPFVFLFWVCSLRSLFRTCDDKVPIETRQRHAISLLLMLSTAVVTIGLGRGLTHRLFLLPAGLLLSISDIDAFPRLISKVPYFFSAYIFAIWISFAYVQRNASMDVYYNSRSIVPSGSRSANLCVTQGSISNKSNGALSGQKTLYFEALPDAHEDDFRCWSPLEVQDEMFGFVHVEEIANSLGIAFKNNLPGKGDYFEKWDWRKTRISCRLQWSKDQAARVNLNRVPYFIERLNIMPKEYFVPGYQANIQPRKLQLSELVERTGSYPIARLGRFTLWRTKWAAAASKKVE